MYGTSQNPYQSKLLANQFIGKPIDNHMYLPMIRNKYRDLEDEKQRLVNETLNFVQNKSKRVQASRQPFNNYPLYNQDINNFLNHYPHSLMHYRPIRYFFQRPFQLDENFHFPHQKEAILRNRAEYNTGIDIKNNVKPKYAKPLRYRDLVNEAEELELPMAKVISAGEVNSKIQELSKVKEQLFKLDPKRKKEIRQKNKRHWQLLYKLNKVLVFWHKILDEFKIGSKRYKGEKTLLDRAQKADMIDLYKFFGSTILRNLETYIIENFGDYLTFNSTNERKNEDCVYKVKHFVHKIFHDLSICISDKSDIDPNLKGILTNYISENKYINPNFITTHEFNRLEFDLSWTLKNLNQERKAMLLNNLILYRVILLEVLKNPHLYFKDMYNAKPGGNKEKTEYDFMDRNINRNYSNINNENNINYKSKEEIELDKIGKKDVYKILENNFIILSYIFNHIIKDAFKVNHLINRDKVKEKFMYKHFVIGGLNLGDVPKEKIINEKIAVDDNELSNRVPPHEQAKLFIQNNQRWCNLYKMNAYAFCVNLVDQCNTSEFMDNQLKSDIIRDRRVEELRNKRRDDAVYGEDIDYDEIDYN